MLQKIVDDIYNKIGDIWKKLTEIRKDMLDLTDGRTKVLQEQLKTMRSIVKLQDKHNEFIKTYNNAISNLDKTTQVVNQHTGLIEELIKNNNETIKRVVSLEATKYNSVAGPKN